MTYYAIRHKRTQEMMPQMRRRGYSHWNPDEPKFLVGVIPVPRLLPTLQSANKVIAQWYCCPNSVNVFGSVGIFGDEGIEPEIKIKLDNRKKEDLEIVEIEVSIGEVVGPQKRKRKLKCTPK